MPKSQGPRKPMSTPKWQKDAINAGEMTPPPPPKPRARPARAPINAAEVGPSPVSPSPVVSDVAEHAGGISRGRLMGGAALGAGALVGGGLYLRHRARMQNAQVTKLLNPFDDEVYAVMKADYPVAVPPQRSQRVAALVPTGRHVSTANNYEHGSYNASPRDSRLLLVRRDSRNVAKMDRKTTRRLGYGAAVGGAAGQVGVGAHSVLSVARRQQELDEATERIKSNHISHTGRVLPHDEAVRAARDTPEYNLVHNATRRITARNKYLMPALGAASMGGLITGVTHHGTGTKKVAKAVQRSTVRRVGYGSAAAGAAGAAGVQGFNAHILRRRKNDYEAKLRLLNEDHQRWWGAKMTDPDLHRAAILTHEGINLGHTARHIKLRNKYLMPALGGAVVGGLTAAAMNHGTGNAYQKHHVGKSLGSIYADSDW
jgi:hypothetical protein